MSTPTIAHPIAARLRLRLRRGAVGHALTGAPSPRCRAPSPVDASMAGPSGVSTTRRVAPLGCLGYGIEALGGHFL